MTIIRPPVGGYSISKPVKRVTCDDVAKQIDDFFKAGGEIEELPGVQIEKVRKAGVSLSGIQQS
jgi:hypothetical protein